MNNEYYRKQADVDRQRQQQQQQQQTNQSKTQFMQNQLKRDDVLRSTSTPSNGLSTPWYNKNK